MNKKEQSMVQQTLFKNKYCKASRIILTTIIGLPLFSCSSQENLIRIGFKSYPPREDVSFIQGEFKSYPPRKDNDTVVIYKREKDIPIDSEQIGRLEAACTNSRKYCNLDSIISLAKTKINKAGGNALLITKFDELITWDNSRLSLNGDVFLVHNFPSPDTVPSFADKYMYVGFGIGPETGISLCLPKFSLYNFQDRKYFETYYGIEMAAWIFEALILSLDCLYGVKKNIFTFDTSIGLLWYPKLKRGDLSEDLGPYFHTTMNPKIGIKFRKVWLKAGPSIHLYKDYPKDQKLLGFVDLGKIGKMYYNFEILIKC